MIFAENLSIIYNKEIKNHKYPTALKVAKLIAFFKKGDKYQPKNYWPISFLSFFNKRFEKLLCKRLVKFIEANKILFEYQYGFRKLYSTTLALIEFTDSVFKFIEGQYCMSIFVNLTKGFDTVDHETLSDKLDMEFEATPIVTAIVYGGKFEFAVATIWWVMVSLSVLIGWIWRHLLESDRLPTVSFLLPETLSRLSCDSSLILEPATMMKEAWYTKSTVGSTTSRYVTQIDTSLMLRRHGFNAGREIRVAAHSGTTASYVRVIW